MGLFGISGKKIDEFANSLAQELSKRYPPDIGKNSRRKISEKKISSILEDLYAKARQFKTENKLGLYKKARLGNSFRWALKELDYTEQFINVATEGLLMYIDRKN